MSGLIKNIKAAFGDVEMTPYTVIVERGGYEERLYPSMKWVCTSMKGTDQTELVSPMFRKLFSYISGRNEPNIRINMTSPVTTYVDPDRRSKGEATFTMGFLIPAEHQSCPPPPGDKSIFVEERPELVVLTRRFGGYTSNEVITKEAKELAEEIKSQNEEGVNFNQYYVVGYDPPFKLFGRRNEIWYVKERSSKADHIETVSESLQEKEIMSSDGKDNLKNGEATVDSLQSKVEEALGHQLTENIGEE